MLPAAGVSGRARPGLQGGDQGEVRRRTHQQLQAGVQGRLLVQSLPVDGGVERRKRPFPLNTLKI